MLDTKGWISLKIQDQPRSESDPLTGAGSKPAPILLMSVPKKIIRLATDRNRVKRLIREAFRRENRLQPGKTYLFSVKRKPGELALQDVREAMDGLITGDGPKNG